MKLHNWVSQASKQLSPHQRISGSAHGGSVIYQKSAFGATENIGKMSLSFTPKYFVESELASWLLRTDIKTPLGRTTIGSDLIIAESEKIRSEGEKVGTNEHALEGGFSDSFVDDLVERHLKS